MSKWNINCMKKMSVFIEKRIFFMFNDILLNVIVLEAQTG